MIFRSMVLDNILKNPAEARKVAELSDWGPFGDGYYQGRTSMDQVSFPEIEYVFASLFPQHKHLPYSSRFRLARKNEEQSNTIHCDFGSEVSGILYLTENNKEEVYTSFYQDQYGFDNYVDFKKAHPEYTDEMLHKDFQKNSLWTEKYKVEGKFNRLVLFDASLWHGPSLGFGNDFESGRLIQVFFLSRGK